MESQGNLNVGRDLHREIICAYQKKEFESCLTLIDESLTINSSNTHHKILQTSCWTSLNIKGPETFEVLNQIVKDEPRNSFAYYCIGLKHYNEGDLMECIDFLSKAIELNPTSAMQKAVELKYKAKSVMEAICDANMKFEKNCFEKAMRALSTAMFTDPKNLKIREKIDGIKQYFMKDLVGRLEREVKENLMENCKQIDMEGKVTKAEELIKNGKVEEANKMIEDVFKSDSKHKKLNYLKGFSLYMQGTLKEAIPELAEALILNPDHENAKEIYKIAVKVNELFDSAVENTKAKKHEEAITILTEVIKLNTKNFTINQAAFFQRALAHYSMGNSNNALKDFKKFEALQKGHGERIDETLKMEI